MKKIEYKQYNETIYHSKVQNRLNLYHIKKEGFSKSFVSLNAPIGSIHQSFMDENHQEVKVPKGVAHFLEHKVFEKDGQDMSKYFALQEASINAFTEHHQTTYIFSATNYLIENTNRLLEMFFHPNITEKGVQNEKNIITEELNMYQDDPSYIQYKNLINNLFHHHPIKDDILGTKESIQAIQLKDLKSMHEAYYQPEVCNLIVVSSIDPKELFEALNESITFPEKTFKYPSKFHVDEPKEVLNPYEKGRFDVKIPSILYGIKVDTTTKDALDHVKQSLALSIFLDLTLGKSSNTYQKLLDQGLINDTFGLEVAFEKAYGYILIGSETLTLEKTDKALYEIITQLKDFEIKAKDFNRLKKQMLGNFIHGLDQLESLAYHVSEYIHYNVQFYDVLEIARNLTLNDVQSQSIRFDEAYISRYSVEPKTNS